MRPPDATAEPFRPIHWIAMLAPAVLYGLFVALQWSEAYIDFGDGNYLYISWRIAQGAVVYRDILAPQPPVHLFTGAAIMKIGEMLGLASSLYLVRAFSLLLHLATAAVIADIARLAWGRAWTGVIAAALFLIMPIGLWWSMGYESESIEIFFLVAMMRFALRPAFAPDIATGICGALAALSNATAAPFLLVLIAFMLARNWRRALRVALPALALAGSVSIALEIWSDGFFWRNVVLNQVGTYPSEGLFDYIIFRKIIPEGVDIIWLEGGFIFLAMLGFFRFMKASPLEEEARLGLAWFCVATIASFAYVSKGGTADYIFCLAEPALAILGAGELARLGSRFSKRADEEGASSSGRGVILVQACALGLLTLFALGPSLVHYLRLWNQAAFELPDLEHAGKDARGATGPNVARVKAWIEQYSEPDDLILAPPHYAYITGRPLWGDYSELFIWKMKYINDANEGEGQGEGWTKSRELAEALERREIPIVVIELDQTGAIPGVAAALVKNYRSIVERYPIKTPPNLISSNPATREFNAEIEASLSASFQTLRETPLSVSAYPTLNTRLGVFVPKSD